MRDCSPNVTWLGISLGGWLCFRAAALEPRIARVIASSIILLLPPWLLRIATTLLRFPRLFNSHKESSGKLKELDMATFVIVHGGWGGGWERTPVARKLRERGHEVFTPTLTGLGERAHLGSDFGLSDHIEDIARRKQGHEAFDRNDLDTLWHWYGRNQMAGDHRGRDAVFEQFGKMGELTGGSMKIEPQDYLASGSRTAALMRFTATRGDRRLDARLCEVAEWRDGKLVEAWAYLTDQYTFDEFWS